MGRQDEIVEETEHPEIRTESTTQTIRIAQAIRIDQGWRIRDDVNARRT
jgi:hypothetical protein